MIFLFNQVIFRVPAINFPRCTCFCWAERRKKSSSRKVMFKLELEIKSSKTLQIQIHSNLKVPPKQGRNLSRTVSPVIHWDAPQPGMAVATRMKVHLFRLGHPKPSPKIITWIPMKLRNQSFNKYTKNKHILPLKHISQLGSSAIEVNGEHERMKPLPSFQPYIHLLYLPLSNIGKKGFSSGFPSLQM